MFTPNERAFIVEQRFLRIATVAPDGQPDVVTVSFDFDGHRFFIGGLNNPTTRKFRNVQAGEDRVALVLDDLASVEPYRPRGLRVYGHAEIVERKGYAGPGQYLAVTPDKHWSWGIEGPIMSDGKANFHRTSHDE